MLNEMLKKFANECVCFGESYELFERTMKVYDFLQNHRGTKFTPSEIAEFLGYSSTYTRWTEKPYTIIHYHRVVNPLYWLLRMGLVQREEYNVEVEIESYHSTRRVEKVINGTLYVGYEPCGDTYTKTVKAYRWFVE